MRALMFPRYASMTLFGVVAGLGASFVGRRPLVERSSFDVHGAADAYEVPQSQGIVTIGLAVSGMMETRDQNLHTKNGSAPF